MFAFPDKAAYGRTVPKNLIYANARPSTRVKNLFVAEVSEIIWQYKLSPETINLEAKDGYAEIQVFDLSLKTRELSPDVLATIDKAIPYPVLYRIRHGDRVKHAAAYKRPAQDGTGKWVVGNCYETRWGSANKTGQPLPVALDLKSLYEQMLLAYIPLTPVEGESLQELVNREYRIRQIQRQLKELGAKLKKEKQFKRKVEINGEIRKLNAELDQLPRRMLEY
jgi:hypothetical protein